MIKRIPIRQPDGEPTGRYYSARKSKQLRELDAAMASILEPNRVRRELGETAEQAVERIRKEQGK